MSHQTKSKETEETPKRSQSKTYESKTKYESDDDLPVYKSIIAPRSTIIQRTSYSGPQSGSNRQMMMQQSAGASWGPPPGAYSTVASSGASSITQSRKEEKKDMQHLNERLANFIEKVRFLESQNRKLADQLERLRHAPGRGTENIKQKYEGELAAARKFRDDAEKEKNSYMIKNEGLTDGYDDVSRQLEGFRDREGNFRETIEKQNQQLSDYEAEINLLRRRLETLESDRDRDKKEIARLTEALNRARIDLDNETLNHIDAENRRQTLEEELEFLKQVHEQELKELAALAYRDTTNENREFWKNELSGAVREIQTEYDSRLDSMRGELEQYYNLKVQEFRTGATRQNMESTHSKEESKRLRGQLTDMRSKMAELESRNAQLELQIDQLRREYEDREREWESENNQLKTDVVKLRAELESILKELQDIMDTKLGLELEIAAYRKLLEGEENRIGLKHVVDSWVSSGQVETSEDSSLKVSQVVKGEMSAKTTYQRSAKGPVAIAECAADGKYICLENTGRREENMSGWRVKRVIDGVEKADYTIERMAVNPNRKFKIWAGSKPMSASRDDIEANLNSWGMGANITTKLMNPAGEDRATHVQKTIYTS